MKVCIVEYDVPELDGKTGNHNLLDIKTLTSDRSMQDELKTYIRIATNSLMLWTIIPNVLWCGIDQILREGEQLNS
jgi:hypothetical protein